MPGYSFSVKRKGIGASFRFSDSRKLAGLTIERTSLQDDDVGPELLAEIASMIDEARQHARNIPSPAPARRVVRKPSIQSAQPVTKPRRVLRRPK